MACSLEKVATWLRWSSWGYQTLGSANIAKPRDIDYDGPSGLNEGGITHEPYSTEQATDASRANSPERKPSSE